MTKRQELKNKIIKEMLPNLSIDWGNYFVDAKELSNHNYRRHKTSHGIPEVKIDPDGVLEEQDYEEIYQAIVDDIKQHADEWKIDFEDRKVVFKHASGRKYFGLGHKGGAKRRREVEQTLDHKKYIPKGISNPQELKEKIIKEVLPKLSVDPWGGWVWADYLTNFTYEDINDYYFDSLPSVFLDFDGILSKQDCEEINRAMIEDIKLRADEWKIEKENKLTIVKHKSGRKHYREGFAPSGDWTGIESALNHNKNNIPVVRKCGFSDCEKRISWEKTECNNCWDRKENYVCDACCQKQSYNISFLIGVRDFVNETEIALKRVRGLIIKLPKFSDKLKEVEKSLILTEEEKRAEEKNHSFRINFLQEKNGSRQRDNIHLFI